MKTASLKTFAAAAATMLLVVPSLAQAQATGIVTEEYGQTCYKTTFEGGGNFAPAGAPSAP